MFLEIFIIIFYTIFFSLIIWLCLLSRYIFSLLLLMLFALSLFITRLMYERISPFLIINKKNNKKICQSISLKVFISLSLKNNFRNGCVTSNIGREISKSKSDLIKHFKHNKYKTFETTTNETMYSHLAKISKYVDIEIVQHKDTIKIKPQIIPKLMLMGVKTNFLNLFNIKYWTYIFKCEKVAKYKIIIK